MSSNEDDVERSEYPRPLGRVKDLMSPGRINVTKSKKKLDPYADSSFDNTVDKEPVGNTTDNSLVKVTVGNTTDTTLDNDLDEDSGIPDSWENVKTTPCKQKTSLNRSLSDVGSTLAEYTNRVTPSPNHSIRSTVGKTTVPPPTPIGAEASIISPATSTPGATPARQRNGSLIK